MSSPADDILVIKNGTLIDGTGGGHGRTAGSVSAAGRSPGSARNCRPIRVAGADLSTPPAGSSSLGSSTGHVHLSMFHGAPQGISFPTTAEFCTLWGGPEPDADPPRGVHQRLGTRRRVVRRCDAAGRGEQRDAAAGPANILRGAGADAPGGIFAL